MLIFIMYLFSLRDLGRIDTCRLHYFNKNNESGKYRYDQKDAEPESRIVIIETDDSVF